MNQPNLVDIIIALSLVGSVLGACSRGLGREMLHTVLFSVAVATGLFFIRDNPMPVGQMEVASFVLSALFYVVAMFVFVWGGMRIVGPLVIGREMIGMRSRFWAGALSIVKLLAIIFSLNLWFAAHSPDAHPLRLNSLPTLMRESMLVQLSDKLTEQIYMELGRQGLMDYHKVTQRPVEEPAVQGDVAPASVADHLMGNVEAPSITTLP